MKQVSQVELELKPHERKVG
jgi:5'-AMP-activated protein kinase, catalytic alpha subunit